MCVNCYPLRDNLITFALQEQNQYLNLTKLKQIHLKQVNEFDEFMALFNENTISLHGLHGEKVDRQKYKKICKEKRSRGRFLL